jgi:NAD-dependent deacetylase
VAAFHNIVILTGAGLSAESGLGTSATKVNGGRKSRSRRWRSLKASHPTRLHDFYNLRRRRHRDARPNAAHTALARLERDHTGNVLTVTQNIDALHEVAGTRNLIHMHGELTRALCAACGTSTPWSEDLTVETACLACGEAAMRPDVVWFGEMPREMDARGMRPVHLHRHERQRLSGRRLCGGGETRRRAHGRAQS